jgi:excisionase family DNA binding protein
MSSDDAAKLLGIHSKTLQKMARKQLVPSHRVGTLWRFRGSELDAWLEAQLNSEETTRAA